MLGQKNRRCYFESRNKNEAKVYCDSIGSWRNIKFSDERWDERNTRIESAGSVPTGVDFSGGMDHFVYYDGISQLLYCSFRTRKKRRSYVAILDSVGSKLSVVYLFLLWKMVSIFFFLAIFPII